LNDFGATLIGRLVGRIKETGGNLIPHKFFTDIQARWTPGFWGERLGFAVGVNNLFDTKIPGCITCDLNNFDPTMYDVPGRYYYARATVKY
jgi:iron complex outermembrane receptor protein